MPAMNFALHWLGLVGAQAEARATDCGVKQYASRFRIGAIVLMRSCRHLPRPCSSDHSQDWLCRSTGPSAHSSNCWRIAVSCVEWTHSVEQPRRESYGNGNSRTSYTGTNFQPAECVSAVRGAENRY